MIIPTHRLKYELSILIQEIISHHPSLRVQLIKGETPDIISKNCRIIIFFLNQQILNYHNSNSYSNNSNNSNYSNENTIKQIEKYMRMINDVETFDKIVIILLEKIETNEIDRQIFISFLMKLNFYDLNYFPVNLF